MGKKQENKTFFTEQYQLINVEEMVRPKKNTVV